MKHFVLLLSLAGFMTPLAACSQTITCNTQNIQECLDNHPNAHILLPAGWFSPPQPLMMRGQGQWLSGANDAEWNGKTVIIQQIQAPPSAQGGRISDLEIANCVGDGIQIGAGEFTVDHVSVESCTGRGIGIYGDSSLWPASEADKWHLEDVKLSGNGGDGLYVAGCDGNNGIATNLQVMINSGWGIYENSCFGNLYQNPNVIANRTGSIWTRGNSNGSVFEEPYIELGQGNAQIKSPALVYNANLIDLSTQADGQAIYVNGDADSGYNIRAYGLSIINPRDQQVLLQMQGGATTTARRVIQFLDKNGSPTFSLFQDSGCVSFQVGSSDFDECPDGSFRFYGAAMYLNGHPVVTAP